MLQIPLNNGWLFADNQQMNNASEVRLPHTNKVLKINYIDEREYQFTAYYEKKLNIEAEWLTKSLVLTFEGVAHRATVRVNGNFCASHNSGYTAFDVDITPYVVKGKNTISVQCESEETLDFPPFGGVIDYLTYGGIYREVYLTVKEKTHINDLFVKGYSTNEPLLLQGKDGLDRYNLSISLDTVAADNLTAEFTLTDGKNQLWQRQTTINNGKCTACAYLENVADWSIDSPKLYLLEAKIISNEDNSHEGKQIVDCKTVRFGFRTARFSTDGFYLNGKKVTLRGLNRHQSYPYVGYAMPRRPQQLDAYICKNELGLNIVRTSHYPQSHHFLDACDELGLLVFTEIPGWQHIGGEQWQKQAVQNVREMVMQYRNHPCIVCWGVRINESADCDQLYTQTNALCKELDDSRATAGVRFMPKSHLLEDIYSYNDFNYNGAASPTANKQDVCPLNAPMLITEFNGHMFPTKNFDDESHRTQHALRHLTVMNDYYGKQHLCGGLGWCMFDYNTHREFGSGDKICHHGVMDMFRNAKLATAAYAMQGEAPYMRVSSTFDKGEWVASNLDRVYVFTNAKSVKLYRNKNLIGSYLPDDINFPHLPHAPIVIDDFIGQQLIDNEGFSEKSSNTVKKCLKWIARNGTNRLPLWIKLNMVTTALKEHISVQKLISIATRYVLSWGSGNNEFTVEAIFKDKTTLTQHFGSVNKVTLNACADTLTLEDGNTYDVATIRLQAKDQNANLCPYFNEPVTLKAEGAIELIGDEVISLKGGMGGTYVKSISKGEGSLTLDMQGERQTLHFIVK